MKKIPITIPYIDARDQKKVSNAVINGWGDKCFENIKNFELKFENEVEKYCYMWKQSGEYSRKK